MPEITVLTDQEKEDFIACVENIGDVWDLDVHLVPFYSGRFMYGESCFGLVVENEASVMTMLLAFSKLHHKLAQWLTAIRRIDNMGRDYIVYFPGYLWTESVANETAQTGSGF